MNVNQVSKLLGKAAICGALMGGCFSAQAETVPSASMETTSPDSTTLSSVEAKKKSGIPQRAQQVLDFWFGSLPDAEFYPEEKMSIWFAATPAIHCQIRQEFTQDILSGMRGDFTSWKDTPKGRLALILLLDQIPRHIYRNHPQSFASDAMARALVLEGIQKGDDQQLYPIEKAFFYLPLEHSEDLKWQNLSINCYQQLVAQAPLIIKNRMQDFYHCALLHQQQIARFGRFPHRNAILGRHSTPEEIIFLNLSGKIPF